MFGFLKKIIGTKQDRDLKQYLAAVAEINHNFEQYQSLSNDELRSKTLDFRQRIQEYLSDIDAEIQSINQQALDAEDFNDKETLFKEVDALRKTRDKSLEDILLSILPGSLCRGEGNQPPFFAQRDAHRHRHRSRPPPRCTGGQNLRHDRRRQGHLEKQMDRCRR